MRRLSLRTLLLASLLCLTAHASLASDGAGRPRRQPALRDVRKIYVGDMGRADEAERFRFLLGEELTKQGFVVVERAEDADAVLSGALSVRVGDDSTEARAFVKLESPIGQRLWAKDFGNRLIFNPLKRKEPTKRRASEIAKELRSDRDKAGK
ncbi:MAG TPA: hypothetical protein VM864_07720 [Pyrinomonadaceae bacterium]|jgi:hypothetical protein|nr:hypothetical protein [Pyrinomonadaceae bacterium]